MTQWHKTNFSGVRYRKHATRKYGVLLDKYFTIRCQLDGKRHEEGLGWASKGWSEQKAALELEKLKQNHKIGEGPIRLKEKRQLAQNKRDYNERKQITFNKIFKEYMDWAKSSKKSWKVDEYNYNHFIKSYFDEKLLSDITPHYLEKIKSKLTAKGFAPATVKHCLVLIRQVFNKAIFWGMWTEENPIKKVTLPTLDNQKERVLTPAEEKEFMPLLKLKSERTWAMAMISLYAGLRFMEIATIRWQQVNFRDSRITIHGKGGKTRTVPMNSTVLETLKKIKKPNDEFSDLIFPSNKGGVMRQVSNSYTRIVRELGLNKKVSDRRYKLDFHSLRHSFTTRLATAGTPLHVLRDLLGHSNFNMVSRYAHLMPSQADSAMKALDKYQRAC